MMNKWISVKDELPKSDEFVYVCASNLGTDKGKPIAIARYVDNNYEWFWDFLGQYEFEGIRGASLNVECVISYDDITHWMPLPKPPSDEIE